MAQLNLGRVKGDKGDKGDAFKYEDFTEEQLAALKGADGTTPTIKVGTVTTLDETQNATVTASTSGTTTTFNFGIPQGKGADASIFNGTSAQYEAQKSEIEDGTVVNITDDMVDGELLGVDTLNRISDMEDEVASFDASKVNKTDILTTMEQVNANTDENALPSATVVKELSNSLVKFEDDVIVSPTTAVTEVSISSLSDYKLFMLEIMLPDVYQVLGQTLFTLNDINNVSPTQNGGFAYVWYNNNCSYAIKTTDAISVGVSQTTHRVRLRGIK